MYKTSSESMTTQFKERRKIQVPGKRQRHGRQNKNGQTIEYKTKPGK